MDGVLNTPMGSILVLLGCITLIVLYAFWSFLFQDNYYVFKGIGTDSLDALYPYLYNTAESFAHHKVPRWSFHFGMGQNTFPLFLRDPFDLFIYILGPSSILLGLVYLEIIKIYLIGLLFFQFLKTAGVSNLSAIFGSISYTFCSYVVIGGVWHFFSFEALNLALLLYAAEQLMKTGKSRWLFLPFFFIGLTMPLNLYFFGLFLFSYIVFRLLHTHGFSWPLLGKTCAQFLLPAAIGLALSGPFLIQNVVLLLHNPRVGGGYGLANRLLHSKIWATDTKGLFFTAISRFFCNDLAGSADGYTGWRNTFEAPMFYCGTLCLLLAPSFFSGLQNRRTKIALLVFAAVWLLPSFFPWLRYAFWLFSGDYFRVYSFFVSVLLVLFATFALDNKVTKPPKSIWSTAISILVPASALFVPSLSNKLLIDNQLRLFILILLAAYGCLLYAVAKLNSQRQFKYLLVGVAVFECCCFTHLTVNGWNAVTAAECREKKGYNDNTINALHWISQRDATFYRVDKNYFSSISGYYSLNDGLIQDFNGTTSYGSFNQSGYIGYLRENNLIDRNKESASRWSHGLTLKPISESLNGVKYFLVKKGLNPEWYLAADSLAQVGDVKVYRNKFALPPVYVYDKYINQNDFEKLDSQRKKMCPLYSCVVDEATKLPHEMEHWTANQLEAMLLPERSDMATDMIRLTHALPDLLRDSFTISRFDDETVCGEIESSRPEILFLSIPYDVGWEANVDSSAVATFPLNGGMTGLFLAKGKHRIKLSYRLQGIKLGICLSIIGMLALVIAPYFRMNAKNGAVE